MHAHVSTFVFLIFYKVHLNSEGAACSCVSHAGIFQVFVHLCVKQRRVGERKRDTDCRSRREPGLRPGETENDRKVVLMSTASHPEEGWMDEERGRSSEV